MNAEYQQWLEQVQAEFDQISKGQNIIMSPFVVGAMAEIINHQASLIGNFPQFIHPVIPTAVAEVIAKFPKELAAIQFSKSPKGRLFVFNKFADEDSVEPIAVNLEDMTLLEIKSTEKIPSHQVKSAAIEISINIIEDFIQTALDNIKKLSPKIPIKIIGYNKKMDPNKADELLKNEILNKIEIASEDIKSCSGRAANFIIVQRGIGVALQDEISTFFDFLALPISLKRVGSLNNKFSVLFDERLSSSPSIIVGYRGSHYLDTGINIGINSLFNKVTKLKNEDMGINASLCMHLNENYFRILTFKENKPSLESPF